jgi:hypothetical protein
VRAKRKDASVLEPDSLVAVGVDVIVDLRPSENETLGSPEFDQAVELFVADLAEFAEEFILGRRKLLGSEFSLE